MRTLSTRRDGTRLWVELNSPGAAVNVFGHHAAAELDELLDTLPDDVEQLVLRSTKPGSFINGAGLLYANSMKSENAAVSTSSDVRGVYERLAACGLDTVAVIEGNCYGCGLELALCCGRRIARDVYEAHFRMTELVDYRFVPLFGGTFRLPRLVGAEATKRLLLDGETWSAADAQRFGLVDETLPNRRFDAALDRALSRPASTPRARPPPARPRAARRVPPQLSTLWKLTEGLIDESTRVDERTASAAELSAFAATVTSPAAKRAMRYFFTRHMAKAAALGSTERRPPELALRPRHADRSAFAQELRRRTPLFSPSRKRTVTPRGALRADVGRVELLFPCGVRANFCELRSPQSARDEAVAVARYLDWIGYEPLLTRGADFVSPRLLHREAELRRRLSRFGIPTETQDAALFIFGAERSFRQRAEPPESWREIVALYVETWRSALEEVQLENALFHGSQADVLARELFGFPLEHGSLSHYLTQDAGTAPPP